MKPFICVGDKTSGGGVVVEGSPQNQIDGRPMARVGDKATCTRKNHPHTVTIVTTSDPSIIVDGQPAAFHGDQLSCGCKLIAAQFIANSDPGGGGDSGGSSASENSTPATAMNPSAKFNDKFILLDDATGQPLQQTEYAIKRATGDIEHGTTDDDGHTHLLSSTVEAEPVDIFV